MGKPRLVTAVCRFSSEFVIYQVRAGCSVFELSSAVGGAAARQAPDGLLHFVTWVHSIISVGRVSGTLSYVVLGGVALLVMGQAPAVSLRTSGRRLQFRPGASSNFAPTFATMPAQVWYWGELRRCSYVRTDAGSTLVLG